MKTLNPDLVIVGAGPAGLTAARHLAATADVLVIEREEQAGGIPRHSDHIGYGLRDLHRVMTGPQYALRLVERARDAGVDLRTGSMVTRWRGDRMLEATTPAGIVQVQASAVLLATGARERSRAARMIPGDRAAGVMTTGQLQSTVHLLHRPVGTRAVVVGSELVSWSAVLTLREAGCATVLMTTTYDRPESYAAFNLAGRALLRVPVATRTRVTRIIGRERVSAIEVEDLATGIRREVACDTVILTGEWAPDSELARAHDLAIDHAHGGPLIDTAQRTSAPGVFAAGNLCHPVDTADVAALDGAAAAAEIVRWLQGVRPSERAVRLTVDAPLRWVSPGLVRPGDPSAPRERLVLWADETRWRPRITVRQGADILTQRTVNWPMSPGRAFRLPWSVLSGVDPRGADVTISVR